MPASMRALADAVAREHDDDDHESELDGERALHERGGEDAGDGSAAWSRLAQGAAAVESVPSTGTADAVRGLGAVARDPAVRTKSSATNAAR